MTKVDFVDSTWKEKINCHNHWNWVRATGFDGSDQMLMKDQRSSSIFTCKDMGMDEAIEDFP